MKHRLRDSHGPAALPIRRASLLVVAILATTSCLDESINSAGDNPIDDTNRAVEPGDTPPLTPPTLAEGPAGLEAYEVCDESSKCGDGLECINLLGSQVCMTVGCAEEDVSCKESETCIVSPSVDARGVCARTGASDFCGRNCRDALVCSLDLECIKEGCCDTVDADGCPSSCADLDAMECEIAPRCPANCCGS